MTRIYGPGNRRRVTPVGKWSETARVNLDLHRFRAAVYIVTEQYKNDELNKDNKRGSGEEGPEIFLGLSRDGELMYLNLCTLTHIELTALKELFNIAFANAQDIVLNRDAIAKEALRNGDDSYTRVYRRVPEIIIREGQKWADYPRVRRGFEWIAHLVQEFDISTVNLRGSSKPVPERDQEESVTENGES